MGKNDFLTPKAISNRIKSKGLQKLRWYCQMCQKQCRDENGFKCHLTSESHRRQMMILGENPRRVVEGYSHEFEQDFLDHLRCCHPSTRVLAKNVYNEYIANKNHIHMNATKWVTLTGFVQYLGRTGKCKVDQTEKGWYILYIKKGVEELEEEKRGRRRKAEKDEEERNQHLLKSQIKRALKSAKEASSLSEGSELRRDEGDITVLRVDMSKPTPTTVESKTLKRISAFEDSNEGNKQSKFMKKSISKQEEIMLKELETKKRKFHEEESDTRNSRIDKPWITENIVVKVLSKELKELGYYKEKGVIIKLVSPYVAQIRMISSGDLLQVDQAQLETVLPAVGGSVCILSGPNKGKKGILKNILINAYKAEVKLSASDSSKIIEFEYENISKVA